MRKMLSIALCAIMMAVCSTAAQAEDNNGKKQRMSREQLAEIQAKRIAHEMALDDATNKKFIETFCANQKEVWALGPKPRKGEMKEQSEKEAEQNIKNQFEQSQKLLSIREKYYKIYSEFLTQKQIQRVYELEKKAMKRIAKKKYQKDGKRPSPNGNRQGRKGKKKDND